MTPREVSFATGVNVATVYAHLNRGELHGSRVGGPAMGGGARFAAPTAVFQAVH